MKINTLLPGQCTICYSYEFSKCPHRGQHTRLRLFMVSKEAVRGTDVPTLCSYSACCHGQHEQRQDGYNNSRVNELNHRRTDSLTGMRPVFPVQPSMQSVPGLVRFRSVRPTKTASLIVYLIDWRVRCTSCRFKKTGALPWALRPKVSHLACEVALLHCLRVASMPHACLVSTFSCFRVY